MSFFMGRLFKTLNYYVDNNIKETIYKNEAFKENKWNFFESQIVQWSQRYLFYACMLFGLFILFTVNLLLWKPELKALVSPFINDFESLTDRNSLAGWQQVFLGGQLTIIAVIYPLVVGLIGVLLQNTAGSKTILPIYQKYSGFMFSGLSGLFLPLFILLSYLSRAFISDSAYLAACISSAVWLSLNILLTSWFFVKTFLMLDSNLRDKLVIRYSVQELCVKDVQMRLKERYVEHAKHYNILKTPNESILKIDTYVLDDEGYTSIAVEKSKDISLNNVSFMLLNLAIKLQCLLLQIFNKNNCTLIFRPSRISTKSSTFVLVKANFKINFFVKLLIHGSFSFKKESVKHDESFKAMSDGLLGSANEALKHEDVAGFKVAIQNIIEWHTEISSALTFKNNTDEQDNWLLLSDPGLFGRSYLSELNSEYYQLAQRTSELIIRDSIYFKEVLYLYKRIYLHSEKLAVKETITLIEGNYLQWNLLTEWYSSHLNKNDTRLTNKYEDMLHTFVGYWESWLMSIEYKHKRKGDMKSAYPALICHLELTAQSVVSALRSENYEAAGWAIDMLNNWQNNFSSNDFFMHEYDWQVELLTLSQMKIESSKNSWHKILNNKKYEHVPAFELAFKNAVLDLRLITACYILLKPKLEMKGKVKKQVNKLLTGDCENGNNANSDITNAGELLGAYIRHCDYTADDNSLSYKSFLSSVISKFERMDMGKMVSGRTYSGWGGIDSPQDMNQTYVEIALSMSVHKWQLSGRWYSIILSDWFKQTDRCSLIQELKNWNLIAGKFEDSILFDKSQLNELKNNFKESIEEIVSRIENLNGRLLENAKIDDNKITKLAKFASVTFLEIDNPKYPFSLFSEINNNERLPTATKYVINITGFGKDRIAEGIESAYVINEESWLAESTLKRVTQGIYQTIVNKEPEVVEVCLSIETTFAQIHRLTLDFEAPVLFVSHRDFEKILRKYSYEINKSTQYGIERRDGFGGQYICHIDNCAVYKLPYKDGRQCLITSKNLFKKLLFSPIDFDRKQYVKPSFTTTESEIEGMLSLTFFMEMELSDEKCIQLDLAFDH